MDKPIYSLKIENLPNDITPSDVHNFLDGPTTDILERMEIFKNGPTSTVFLYFTGPDVAYEFLNLEDPQINGNRVTLRPEIFEETSITLNGSWLREIEDGNPTIQIDIKRIADQFQLKLVLQKCDYGDTKRITLAGAPGKIELARSCLNDKIQPIIMNRSSIVHKKMNEPPFQSDVAGIESPGEKKSGQSTSANDMHSINDERKPALMHHYPGALNDHKSDVNNKGSTESKSANPGHRRVRALVKTGETNCEPSDVVATVSNNDVQTNQQSEGRRKRVLLIQKSEEMQKSDSSIDVMSKSPVGHYPVSTQFQRAIRVDMNTNKYLIEHSTELDFSDCSVSQFKVSDQCFDWVIGNNNEKDLRRNEEELRRRIDKLKTECFWAPNEFDFLIFKDLVETSNQNKHVTFIFGPMERNCKIVGPSDEVKKTYKWISEISVELIERNRQKSGKVAYNTRSSAQQLDSKQSGSPGCSPDGKVHKSNVGRWLDPKQHASKAEYGIHISKSSQDRLEFTTRGHLRVSVYQGNMIKQTTEVIVNPANEHLSHAAGLARVILDAGGPVIDDESRKIIAKQGKLQTSEAVHTSAGNLPPPIKYVIHIVGPTAYEFKDNKKGLIPTLKVTFRNCLEYANNRLGVSSISLPPISSGIFAVPIPDIIQGVVEAIHEFDQSNPSAVLKEVHFISNDAKTTEEMISCFLNAIG